MGWIMTFCSVLAAAVSFLPFFESRNAGVNAMLRPPPPPPPGAQAASAPAPATRPPLEAAAKCPACEGAGELLLAEPNFGQSDGRIGRAREVRKRCPLCGGRRFIEGYIDPGEAAMQASRDFEAYSAAHLARGEVPLGGAFVPREVCDHADRKILKRAEKSFGEACKRCNWTGIEPCRKCDGRGILKCPGADCKGGWAVTKTTTSYSRSRSGGRHGISSYGHGFHSGGSRNYTRKETKVTVQLCPSCGGAKSVICPECSGRRAATCRKCSGSGMKKKGL